MFWSLVSVISRATMLCWRQKMFDSELCFIQKLFLHVNWHAAALNMSQASFTTNVFRQKCPHLNKKKFDSPWTEKLLCMAAFTKSLFPPISSPYDLIWPLSFALQVNLWLDLWLCLWVRVLDFTHLSFRPPFLPQCGLSDGPTHCCTWSKSVWQALLCSRDWQVYSWQCSPPQVRTGSEVRAPEGRRERFRGVRSDSGNHHHLSLWEEKKSRLKLWQLLLFSWDLYSFFQLSLCFIDLPWGLTGAEVGTGRKCCSLSIVHYRSLIHTSEQHCPLNCVYETMSFSFDH